ncbi:fimbrial protein [Serratia fonticola]
MNNSGWIMNLLRKVKYPKIGIINFVGFVFFIAISQRVSAVAECISGCGPTTTTINDSLSPGENSVGYIKSSNVIQMSAMQIRMTKAAKAMQWIAYVGEPTPNPGIYAQEWNYVDIDDYIKVALRRETTCARNDTGAGFVYVPFNINIWSGSDSNCEQKAYAAGEIADLTPRDLQSQIKIKRRIVGGTYSKSILIARAGYCQPDDCSSAQVSRNIYLNINITAPETCELNAGQVISIDFGNISSDAFKTAGAIAQGVQPRSRDIGVKCDNISGNAQLTIRLQADKTNGNIVVSDENNDVGFRVTSNSGTPMVPNNLSSVIPFTLNSNARQNVTIQAYPVSVTGNKPTEGTVTSRAYLRVDFP